MFTILIEERGQETYSTGRFETEDEATAELYEKASDLEYFDEDNYTSSGYDDNENKLTVITCS